MRIQNSKLIIHNSFTLIEVLVGIFLVLIIFLGIFGAYQLGLKVVGLSKNKIVATAIANGQLEQIRNLPYELIGTEGAILPYVEGILEPTRVIERNDVEFTIDIKVKYIVDEADGIGEEDECNWDYKRAEIKVSWSGQFTGELKVVTDIAPKNKVEEINTCAAQPGGILSVKVSDPLGKWEGTRGAPLIEVFDSTTGGQIDFYEPLDGKHDFPLVASAYKIAVSKEGYSSEETFGGGDVYNGKVIVTPEKPNPTIIEGKQEEISFFIDKLSSFSIDTLSPWGFDDFSDAFSDESKISGKNNVAVEEGQVKLSTITEGEYYSSGDLTSISILPSNIVKWDEFSFTDSEPENTGLKYQFFYMLDEDWQLIPDIDLPGNSIGFDDSPVDLSILDSTVYSQLKIKANFLTDDSSFSPLLYDWQVSWINNEPTPIPNANFDLRGEKIVGLDADEKSIYKYSQNHNSDPNGHIDILNLEWGNYTFSVEPVTGLDLTDTLPSPHPIGLVPDTILEVALYLKAENSLLTTVQNVETLEPVFSAAVRLYNVGLNYDAIQYTNEEGQTYFIPLTSVDYNLEVSASGYEGNSTTVWVSGDTAKTVKIEQVE